MKVEIKIPAMGESVSEATISTILKPAGSVVKTDDEILELETDKVNQVLYAPSGGAINWSVKVGDTVTIGQVIGFVDSEAAGVAASPKAESKSPPPPAAAPISKKTPEPVEPTQGFNARKMAPEFLQEIKEEQATPSVKEGEKVKPAPTQAGVTRKPMSRLRKVIAARLVEAKNTSAMLTTFNEIDLSKVIEIRNKEKESFQKRYGVRLGFMSFFVKAVVAALKAIPEVNASLEGEDILTYHTYDIGVAVSTDRGLMVPVVRGCDKLTFGGIEAAIEAFAKKARDGNISLDDLRGGSFTITNGGRFGSLLSTPILNPPQSAILGMHTIVKRPVAMGDEIVIRPMMYVALSYDHRIIDGKEAVLFLVHLKESLEDPARLLLDL